jgi:membrane carboxypeptidase/penicillin-binding protein PbpC
VLPADAPGWSAEDLALTLLHERAHISRRDVPKQWAASIVCTLYWFNPLAWIVARTMATDREHAVDALVLERGARASSYAALLVRVAVRADESGLLAPFHAPAVGRADLARRVEAVLATPRSRASRWLRATFGGAIVLAALAAACSQGAAPATGTPLPAPVAATTSGPAARAATPSALLLERALGGATTLDGAKQAATEETLDAWLAEDQSIIRAHVIAMELPSGLVVAVAGRDRASGPTIGLERPYPPASTVKPLVLAAALDAGVLKKDDTIDGQGGSREVTTHDGKKHTMTDHAPQGSMSLEKMLAVSSNVGATKVGERLGAARLLAALDTVGLFAPVDGLVVAPSSRPTLDGDAWHQAVVSIGHDCSVNPLRVVAAFGALASDGEVVAPRLRPATPRTTSRFVSADAARAVTSMLESVVAEGGTGSRARVDGLRIAGKTGTADLDGGVSYASFVGILPAGAPRYVVLVGAETRTGSGGTTAAPRFASLVSRAFR